MPVSVLRLPVRPGAADELERAFAELGVFERSRESGGFRGGRLLRPRRAGEPFLVVAEWEGADDYEQWLRSPVREELAARLAPLLGEPAAAGTLYEEALCAP